MKEAEEFYKKFDIIHRVELRGGKSIPVSMHHDQVLACALVANQMLIDEVSKDKTSYMGQKRLEELKKMRQNLEKL